MGAPTGPATPDPQALAERVSAELYARDRASQALGMRIAAIAPGRCTMTMRVRADMGNGHDVCHGGVIFSLADSAFAFACNSGGVPTLAAAASIDFLAPARVGDQLTAEARELWRRGRSGLYEITVRNQKDELIALFRGRSHRLAAAPVAAEEAGA